MVERRSKTRTSNNCSVHDCEEPRKRSVSAKKVTKALPDLKFTAEGGRAHLCKTHNKEFKKATKKERELNRLGR